MSYQFGHFGSALDHTSDGKLKFPNKVEHIKTAVKSAKIITLAFKYKWMYKITTTYLNNKFDYQISYKSENAMQIFMTYDAHYIVLKGRFLGCKKTDVI